MSHNASQLIELAVQKNTLLTTAESCTGGLVSAALTDVSGSSEVYMQSVIVYDNASKIALLGVDELLIAQHGAVSAEVARAMADGATTKLHSVFPTHKGNFLSVSVTGIAGPSGESDDKPVGLVYCAASLLHENQLHTVHEEHHFKGNRVAVRGQAVDAALSLMQRLLALLETNE